MGNSERDAADDSAVLDHEWAYMDLLDDTGRMVWQGRICIEGEEDVDRINEIVRPYLNVSLTENAVHELLSVLLQAGYSTRTKGSR